MLDDIIETRDSFQQIFTTNCAVLSQAQLPGVPSVGVLSRQMMPTPEGSIAASLSCHKSYSVWVRVCALEQPVFVKQEESRDAVGVLYEVKERALALAWSAIAWDSNVAIFR